MYSNILLRGQREKSMQDWGCCIKQYKKVAWYNPDQDQNLDNNKIVTRLLY